MPTRILLLASALGIAAVPAGAAAETLREAMLRAYSDNPTLTGARAQLRGLDAGVPLARSEGLPQLGGQASYSEFEVNRRNAFPTADRQADAGAQLSIPLYAGGGIRNNVNAAKARVSAGRQGLRSTEANVFLDVVTAYMNVIRDNAVVQLNQGLVNVLKTNVDYTTAGFRAGALTRTDIAQSESRLALAQGQYEAALAQLDSSREGYLRVVGAPPGTLEPPPQLPAFPATPDEAVDVAVETNPDVLAAREQIRATGYAVRVAQASSSPRLSAFGTAGYTNYFNTLGGVAAQQFFQRDRNVTGGAQLNIPLYQGGAPTARTRQAQAQQSAAYETLTETERGIVANTRASYSRYRAALEVIGANERAVAAAQRAAAGVRAESRAGTRDVIDLLNAEQELLNSQVQLVSARRDAYVAGFTLLVALGKAEAKDLGLEGGPLYDPTVHYKRVANDIFDWNADPKPAPVAPRTVGIAMPSVLDVPPAAQTGNILLSPEERQQAPATPAVAPAPSNQVQPNR